MNFEVRTDSLAGTATALGWARGHTVVIDRPADAGGQDLGFNGGELLHLAVAGCVSNDLFREARALGLRLTRVALTARGEFTGDPPVSGGIGYSVEVWGDAPASALRELVARVDTIAEIPNSLRRGTAVRLSEARVHGSDERPAPPGSGG
ncbi:MAG: OsmC family peroxiredoxin [Myxococcaceae bacterium]|nr:MAG: OsmC family peroxiredoxin [Myxococcaceae bacterium]